MQRSRKKTSLSHFLVLILLLGFCFDADARRRARKKPPLKGPAVQFAIQVTQCSQKNICETKNITSELLRKRRAPKKPPRNPPPSKPLSWSERFFAAENPSGLPNSFMGIIEVQQNDLGTRVQLRQGPSDNLTLLQEWQLDSEPYSLKPGMLSWTSENGLLQIHFFYAAAPAWIEAAGYYPEKANIEKPLVVIQATETQCEIKIAQKKSPAFACSAPVLIDSFWDVRTEQYWIVTQTPSKDCPQGPLQIRVFTADLQPLSTHEVPYCRGPKVRVKKIDSKLFISWPSFISSEKDENLATTWIYTRGELQQEPTSQN